MSAPRKVKKINSPIICNSKINFLDEIGHGFCGVVNKYSLEKNGKKNFSAVKKFDNPNYKVGVEDIVKIQNVWKILYENNFPVPRFSKVDLRKNSPTYLNIFREFLYKKNELIDCHKRGRFRLPKKFNFVRDKKVLNELAQDIAKLSSLGVIAEFPDFWNFYKKKDGSLGRLIVDFNFLDYDLKLTKSLKLRNANDLFLSVYYELPNNKTKFYFFRCYQKHRMKYILK